jgi:type VI secretion system VasD/TssJ family lipoprotein
MKLQTNRPFSIALVMALSVLVLSAMSCSSGNKAQGGGQQGGPQAQAPVQQSGPQPQQDEKLKSLGLDPSRPFASKAIQIEYRADPNLNLYQDKPHTLAFVVYQLSDINPFTNLTKDAAGLTTLLKGEAFDKSVMAVNRFFIEPGDANRLDIDRYENVKWVGIVAGYYDLTPGQVTRSYEMPVLIETKGMIFKTNEAKMGLLGMNLFFGPTSIQEVPGP